MLRAAAPTSKAGDFPERQARNKPARASPRGCTSSSNSSNSSQQQQHHRPSPFQILSLLPAFILTCFPCERGEVGARSSTIRTISISSENPITRPRPTSERLPLDTAFLSRVWLFDACVTRDIGSAK